MSSKWTLSGLVQTEIEDGSWSEEEKREIRLILMADELASIAYRAVNWRDVAVLGRAIVALAENSGMHPVK
jgi:hypothetical protein